MIEEDQKITSFNGTGRTNHSNSFLTMIPGYDSRVMFHINNELDRQLQEVDEILSSVNTSYDYYEGSGSGDELDISM